MVLGRNNIFFLCFFPYPPGTCVFPDISEHVAGLLPWCVHRRDGATPWAAPCAGAVPGALCASLRAGPSSTAEKAGLKRDKPPVEKDVGFGESVPALPSSEAGVAVGTVPLPPPGAGTLSQHVHTTLSREELLCC